MGDDDLIRRGDAARAVALCSAESDSPNAHFVCRQAVNAIRAIPAADARLEKLLEQRDEARRDAVEAEAYVGELETKLAKTQTFIYELWDSQGYGTSGLRDLLKELDREKP